MNSSHSLIILHSLLKTGPNIFWELPWILLSHSTYMLAFGMINIAKIV
jgi:hypothetical protein